MNRLQKLQLSSAFVFLSKQSTSPRRSVKACPLWPPILARRGLGARRSKPRHRREAIHLLAALLGGSVALLLLLLFFLHRRHRLRFVERIDSRARGGRGSGRARRLVDVLAVNVDGVGLERRAPVAAARVPLLEAEELDPGLDLFEDGPAHNVLFFAWEMYADFECGRENAQRKETEALRVLNRLQEQLRHSLWISPILGKTVGGVCRGNVPDRALFFFFVWGCLPCVGPSRLDSSSSQDLGAA